MNPDSSICDGCTGCAMRCTDGILISEHEYNRIVIYLNSLNPHHVRKVLEQPKDQPWFEGITYRACLFLDVESSLCLIYEVRPLVCRMFGQVKHLPCPLELIASDLDASRVIEAYTSESLRTFQEWMAAHEIFDFKDLLANRYEPPVYEL